jgi:hypothetical protein
VLQDASAGVNQDSPIGAWVVLALAALALLCGCASRPPAEMTVEVPPGVTDARGRFAEIFCEVFERHGRFLPDYRSCDAALSKVSLQQPATGRPVELGPSQRRLSAQVVPGIGYSCIKEWLQPAEAGAAHVRSFGFDAQYVAVDALSGTETNARQIRDAMLALPADQDLASVVLVGYSKGAPDILEAVARYPEIHGRIAAVVSVAGAVGGSALAIEAKQRQAELLTHWPKAECDPGDGKGVESLRPDVRRAWLAEHPLPTNLRFYSLVALPDPGNVSAILKSSYRKLANIDPRNDGQLIYSDAIIPGSTLLGFVNADHWAIALPVNRTHPAIGKTFANHNDYPREALLEAILRFVEEDL